MQFSKRILSLILVFTLIVPPTWAVDEEEDCAHCGVLKSSLGSDQIEDLSTSFKKIVSASEPKCLRPITKEDEKQIGKVMELLHASGGEQTEEVKRELVKLSGPAQVRIMVEATKMEQERVQQMISAPENRSIVNGLQQLQKNIDIYTADRKKFAGKNSTEKAQSDAIISTRKSLVKEIMDSKSFNEDEKIAVARTAFEMERNTFAWAADRYNQVARRAMMGEAIAKTTAHTAATVFFVLAAIKSGGSSAKLAGSSMGAAFGSGYTLVKILGDAGLSNEPFECALAKEYDKQGKSIFIATGIGAGIGLVLPVVLAKLAPATALKVTKGVMLAGTGLGVGFATNSGFKAKNSYDLMKEAEERGDKEAAEDYWVEAKQHIFHSGLDLSLSFMGLFGIRSMNAKQLADEVAVVRAERTQKFIHDKPIKDIEKLKAIAGKDLNAQQVKALEETLKMKVNTEDPKSLSKFFDKKVLALQEAGFDNRTIFKIIEAQDPKLVYHAIQNPKVEVVPTIEKGLAKDNVAWTLEGYGNSNVVRPNIQELKGLVGRDMTKKQMKALEDSVRMKVNEEGDFAKNYAQYTADKKELLGKAGFSDDTIEGIINAQDQQIPKVRWLESSGAKAITPVALVERPAHSVEQIKVALGRELTPGQQSALVQTSALQEGSVGQDKFGLLVAQAGRLKHAGFTDVETHQILKLQHPKAEGLLNKFKDFLFRIEANVRGETVASGRQIPIRQEIIVQSNSKLTDNERLAAAAKLFGQSKVPNKKAAAILEAHKVGQGEVGLDGKAAKLMNYTPAQLRQKAQILEEAGFSKAQRRMLMEDGIVGGNRVFVKPTLNDLKGVAGKDLTEAQVNAIEKMMSMQLNQGEALSKYSGRLLVEKAQVLKDAGFDEITVMKIMEAEELQHPMFKLSLRLLRDKEIVSSKSATSVADIKKALGGDLTPAKSVALEQSAKLQSRSIGENKVHLLTAQATRLRVAGFSSKETKMILKLQDPEINPQRMTQTLQESKYAFREMKHPSHKVKKFEKAEKFLDEERMTEVTRVLELKGDKTLTPAQSLAVLKANSIGKGEAGWDGTPARVMNFTPTQMKLKAQVLKKAGFNLNQRRTLMEEGLVGGNGVVDPTPSLKEAAAAIELMVYLESSGVSKELED